MSLGNNKLNGTFMLTSSADWKNGQFMQCSVQITFIIDSRRVPGLESSTPVCRGRRTTRSLYVSF